MNFFKRCDSPESQDPLGVPLCRRAKACFFAYHDIKTTCQLYFSSKRNKNYNLEDNNILDAIIVNLAKITKCDIKIHYQVVMVGLTILYIRQKAKHSRVSNVVIAVLFFLV